jgi:hypothetical protein
MISVIYKGMYKKLYLDTRFRKGGSHSDAIFELPIDIETRNTQSVVLGSMTFVNTLETVLSGVNQNLYYLTQQEVSVLAGYNDKFYFLREEGFTGHGVIGTLSPGSYTQTTLAAELQRILRVTTPTATVTWGQDLFMHVDTGNTAVLLYIPTPQEVQSGTWRDANWSGPAYDVNNATMYTGLTQWGDRVYAKTFLVQSILGVYQNTFGAIVQLNPNFYTGSTFAAELQRVLGGTVTFNENSGTLTIDSGDPGTKWKFPSADNLRNKAWKDANWINAPNYDNSNPKSINGAVNAPDTFAQVTETSNIDLQTCREIYAHSRICN